MRQFKLPSKATYFSADSVSNLDMFRKIIGFINALTLSIGVDVITENVFPIDIKFLRPCLLGIVYLAVVLFELFMFFGDLFRVCFVFVSLSVLIQSGFKVYVFLFKRNKVIDLISRVESFITNCNTDRANKIMEKWLLISAHIGLALVVIYGTGSFLLLIYPVIYYLFSGELILHFGFEIPFIDWHTSFGYSLNFLFCGGLLSVFFISAVAATYLYTIFILMTFAQFELIKMQLVILDALIITNENGKNTNDIKSCIKSIADMHNELIE